MSPSLSVAVFASTALLSTIREGIESLGHLVVLVENPATLGENIELPQIDWLCPRCVLVEMADTRKGAYF